MNFSSRLLQKAANKLLADLAAAVEVLVVFAHLCFAHLSEVVV